MKKKELISYLRGICKYYGISVKFSSKKHFGGIGFYDVDKNEIEVCTKLLNAKIACVTMHEIAHALNVRDHKYPIFHLNNYSSLKSKKLKSKFLATAHRAAILCHHYFKGQLPYIPGYDESELSKRNLKEYYLSFDK